MRKAELTVSHYFLSFFKKKTRSEASEIQFRHFRISKRFGKPYLNPIGVKEAGLTPGP